MTSLLPDATERVLNRTREEIIASDDDNPQYVLPNISGDLSRAKVLSTPSGNYDPVPKGYLGDFATLNTTTDHSSADTAYVPMVLYNTDATPPAASGFPIGTIYIQYTA